MDQEIINQSTIGAALREAREAQKLSIEEVSAQLRLSDKQITALEHDDFKSFGSAMLTRGFIKNYARLLSLDPDPLLAAHRSIAPEDQAQSIAYVSQSVSNPADVRMSKPKLLVVSVLIVVTLLAWLIYHNLNNAQSSEQGEVVLDAVNQDAAQKAAEPIALPEPALPLAERADAAIPSNQTSSDVKLPETTSSAGKEVKPAKEEALKTEPLKPEVVKSVAIVGGEKITFRFTEDSWVSVQDKNYKIVFSKLGQKGAVEEVEGLPPLRVVVGNANGTQITFKAKALDLSPYNKNNVVHVTLPTE